jgi:methylase of polypeptide subunit release factors
MSVEWFQPIVSDCGPEKPSHFARVLAENLPTEPEGRLLDIGCGCGVIGLCWLCRKQGRSVTFNDLMPQWLDLTRRNVEAKIYEGAIERSQVNFTTVGSFRTIPEEVIAQHTLVAFNPPQLPSPRWTPKTGHRWTPEKRPTG